MPAQLPLNVSVLHYCKLHLLQKCHNSVRENLIHMEAVKSVLLRTEAQIAGVVEPQSQRVPVSDQEPLTDVELCVVNQERSL